MSGRVLQRRQTYRLLLTTLWLTLLLLGVEAIAGWASQSLLLLAEALHTLVGGGGSGFPPAPPRPGNLGPWPRRSDGHLGPRGDRGLYGG